ncbi:bifunctional 5,10-methylenetetrahydrofolate dehydrogenase/5,10-methenyltetrahydrofolate cyclohydrolase [Candidatus Micrarchaeota archaeon]|nr:bifunctional 5,10-methylenetetrahydrofolate dehydrogenase/5,10-methenyltetrahydrofolate cyclohydrolase [Candidatus Micrarchaeota archaeon]
MKPLVLSGKEPAAQILEEAKRSIELLGRKPVLAIIIVGDYKPSQIYVERKRKTAEEVGIETQIHRIPETISEAKLLELVDKLNRDPKVDGFIAQTPLPKHVNTNKILERIDPSKDVDGFHPHNMGKVLLNIFDDTMFPPATPTGAVKMLEYYGVQFEGKNAVVVGRSNVVGKPAAMMLLHRNCTVTVCHTKTKNLEEFTKKADIIIAAAGSPGLIKVDMIKPGAYIIDVGTTRVGEKVVGDVDFENVIKKAHCSPVPGGVGPLTVAMLLSNTVKAALRKSQSN